MLGASFGIWAGFALCVVGLEKHRNHSVFFFQFFSPHVSFISLGDYSALAWLLVEFIY